jgi:hypothetical protein
MGCHGRDSHIGDKDRTSNCVTMQVSVPRCPKHGEHDEAETGGRCDWDVSLVWNLDLRMCRW